MRSRLRNLATARSRAPPRKFTLVEIRTATPMLEPKIAVSAMGPRYRRPGHAGVFGDQSARCYPSQLLDGAGVAWCVGLMARTAN